MSAIWGYISFDKTECRVRSMASEYRRKCKLDKINEMNYKNSVIGLGLQIVNPEDRHEEMPYVVDSGNAIIVADCILDNREDLIEELLDPATRTERDSEVPDGQLICKAYERWHYDLPRHLRGLFSIAVYNMSEGKLFLCVDQCACRCLNYYVASDGIFFSTLLSPIIKENEDLESNEQYILDYLCLPGLIPNISATETPWKDIFMVEAGCSLIIDTVSREAKPTITRYYSPEKIKVSRNIKKAKKQFLEIYRSAVEDVTRTESDISIALSGGFDSASIATLAAKKLAGLGKKIDAYTYVPFYKEDNSQKISPYIITDESDDVREIAKMYTNITTHFEDDGGEDFTSSLDELIDVMEIPFKAFVNLPTLLRIYKKAEKSGSKVFLNGQCGNASVSFGKIEGVAAYLFRRKKLLSFWRYYYGYCKNIGISSKKNAQGFLRYIKGEIKNNKKLKKCEWDNYVQVASPFVRRDIVEQYDIISRNPSVVRLLMAGPAKDKDQFEIGLYMPTSYAYIGAMETKLGLYSGLIIRDATRDIRVLNYCASIPYEFFCYKGTPRYLVRGFMKDLLPGNILFPIQKRGKQGSDWMMRLDANKEKVFDEIKRILDGPAIDDSHTFRGYLDEETIARFVKQRGSFVCSDEMECMEFFMAIVAIKYDYHYFR